MKKKFKLNKNTYLMILILLVSTSCKNIQKDLFISDLNSLVTDVDQETKYHKSIKWEETDLKFQEFMESDYNKYKSEMSPEERSKVNKLIGKYYAIRMKAGINDLKNEFQDALEQGKGLADEILSDTVSVQNN